MLVRHALWSVTLLSFARQCVECCAAILTSVALPLLAPLVLLVFDVWPHTYGCVNVWMEAGGKGGDKSNRNTSEPAATQERQPLGPSLSLFSSFLSYSSLSSSYLSVSFLSVFLFSSIMKL